MTSSVHPVDIGIFAVFLILNLAIGFFYRRQVKSLYDYTLGGRNFSTGTLSATLVATWIGGSTFSMTVAQIYTNGLFYFFPVTIGMFINLLIVAYVFAPRVGEFLGKLSIADAMGSLYGPTVRVITAIAVLATTVGALALQFKVFGIIFHNFFGLSNLQGLLLGSLVVIIYSVSGGIKAVTFTDVIQFFTFGTLIPILALVVWESVGSTDRIIATWQQNPNFHFSELVDYTNPKFWTAITIASWYIIPGIYPPIFQRISMATNTVQIRKSFSSAAILIFLVKLSLSWIGFLLLCVSSKLKPEHLFHHLLESYSYPGLTGFIIVGVGAMVMSTADSFINAFAATFTHDLCLPLGIKFKNELRVTKIAAFLISMIAVLLVVTTGGFLNIFLLTASLYMPVVSVPFILAILGFRSSRRAVLLGMAGGITTVVIWRSFLMHTGVDSVIPGMLGNVIFFMGSHYLLKQEGGWGRVGDKAPLEAEREARRRAWNKLIKSVKSFDLYTYLQKNLPQEAYFYPLFSFYVIAATYSSLYTMSDSVRESYGKLYQGIYHSVLVATTCFLTYPIWPTTFRSKRFITWVWPLGIFYILFVVGSMLVIMSSFHPVQVMILILNLVMAVLLLYWPLALLLAASGTILSLRFFQWYTNVDTLPGELDSLKFKLIYGLLLFSSFLIALFKAKHAYRQLATRHDNLVTTNEETANELLASVRDGAHFVEAFRKAGVPHLTELTGLSRKVKESLVGLNLPQSVISDAHALNEQLSSMAVQLDRLDHKAVGYLRLEIGTIALDDLLEAVDHKLQAKGMDKNVTFNKATQQARVQCDVARIKTLLVKGVSFLRMTVGDEARIVLHIEDTQLGYLLPSVKKSYTKKIKALRFTMSTASALPKLQPCYPAQVSDAPTTVPQTPQDLPLVTNQRIVSAHYGYGATVVENQRFTLLYVIPIDVKEVRPKDMDKPYMELGVVPVRANDHYKSDKVDAQAQEKEFLVAVEERTEANIDLVKKALEVIKWYHGPSERNTGEPFYLHPVAVAQIVLAYNQDEATVLGALLHDTVEDTPMLLENVETLFNKEVAQIVDGVTHLASNKATFYKVQLSSQENIRQLLEIEDPRVLYVKLADRLHNMRTIDGHPTLAKRQGIAEETMLFFVPLASQLGLKEAAEELKERCFEVFSR